MFGSPVSLRLTKVLLVFGFLVSWTPVQTVLADQPDKPAELPLDRGLMQRLSNFTLKDVTSPAERSRSTVIRAGRRSCSSSSGTTARWATSTSPADRAESTSIRKKGVVFLGINSNAHETEQDVAKLSPSEASISRPERPREPGRRLGPGRADLRGDRARRLRADPLPRRDRRSVYAR